MSNPEPLELPPGIHDIPEDDYHRLTAFSNTDCKLIDRSPAHYYAARLDPEREEKEATPAKIAGQILHCAILEPDQFDSKFVVVPGDAPRKPSVTQRNAANPSEASIRSILWWDTFEEQNIGKTIIKYDDQEKYKKIAHSIRNHDQLKGFMLNAQTEQTFIAKDPVSGLMLRCRADVYNRIGEYVVIIDLKSAEDARFKAFTRACYNYGYFHQDAFYTDVIGWTTRVEVDLFLFAAFEKEPPYAVKLYQSSPDARVKAKRLYRRSIETAAACLESGVWPAYDTDIQPLDYPPWDKD